MGNCHTLCVPAEPRHVNELEHNVNIAINESMKQHQVEAISTHRVLLLGPGDSGKTTMIKQMKKIHGGIPNECKKAYISYIREHLLLCMQTLCQANSTVSLEDDKACMRTHLVKVRDYVLSLKYDEQLRLTSEAVEAIKTLWEDPGIQYTLLFRSKFQIDDNIEYFFDRIDEIAKPTYFPSDDDFLRHRVRTTGFVEEIFRTEVFGGEETFIFIDVGGQRCERKKWLHMLHDNVDTVLYVIAISEYDVMCFEDTETLRIQESLNLFNEVLRKGFLTNKTVTLFFNKYDLFLEKIARVPITVAFKDYPEDKNPHSPQDVIEFVYKKFVKEYQDYHHTSRNAHQLHVHKTCALDTEQMDKLFADIQIDIVRRHMKASGVI